MGWLPTGALLADVKKSRGSSSHLQPLAAAAYPARIGPDQAVERIRSGVYRFGDDATFIHQPESPWRPCPQ